MLLEHTTEVLRDSKRKRLLTFLFAIVGTLHNGLTDDEKTRCLQEFGSREDFQQLIQLLDRDFEEAKAAIYAAAFVHLVEGRVPDGLREDFIYAIGSLRREDLKNAALAIDNENCAGEQRVHPKKLQEGWKPASIRRLENAGAFDPESGSKAPEPNQLGRLLVRLLPL